MTWRHYETLLQGRRASVLFDDRFASREPSEALPELGWFGVYTLLEAGSAYWHPDETDDLDSIESDLIRLCEQVGQGNAVYVRRVATHGIREYYVYFGGGMNLSDVLPLLKLLHSRYRLEYERFFDPDWSHYKSWLSERRGA